MPDSLGDRMKLYERASHAVLPQRMPVILRVDGKNFHAATRECERPFDKVLMGRMDDVATRLCVEAQGAVFAFVQSDEVSVLLHNYKRLNSGSWFDNEVQKMCSVAAGIASSEMTRIWKPVVFDARVFVLPEAEVCNYFIWRQQDATRNSIQMAARAVFSHKQLHRANTSDLHQMLHTKGINWNDYPVGAKRGRAVVRETLQVRVAMSDEFVDRHYWANVDPPIFTQDREFIEQHLACHTEKEHASVSAVPTTHASGAASDEGAACEECEGKGYVLSPSGTRFECRVCHGSSAVHNTEAQSPQA